MYVLYKILDREEAGFISMVECPLGDPEADHSLEAALGVLEKL